MHESGAHQVHEAVGELAGHAFALPAVGEAGVGAVAAMNILRRKPLGVLAD